MILDFCTMSQALSSGPLRKEKVKRSKYLQCNQSSVNDCAEGPIFQKRHWRRKNLKL